ncbi:hypothetical protein [Powai lake megavirus]|uniref:Uncharacterized protein n=1 Tax=Powai lake megavirus TaxID=1842663 RepID=A0A167RLF8_9VIRU|nr:hypothetical protein QJ849_gp665 [Powai lake megavirus]ANB50827.1 hypothetical protein [Powai lake megavirus]
MSSRNYQPSDWPGGDSWSRLNDSPYDKVGFIEGVYDEYDRSKGPTELAFAGLYALRSPDYQHTTPSTPISPTPIIPHNIVPVPSPSPSPVPTPVVPGPLPPVQPMAANQYVPAETFNGNVNAYNPNSYNPNAYFRDSMGRRCRIVCDPPQQNRPPPRPRPPQPRPPHVGQDIDQFARALLGRHITEAQRIYPNTRVVRANGRDLPVTNDFRQDRINVETRNGIVVRIDGFY